jgi:lipid-A-disaccharide synthase
MVVVYKLSRLSYFIASRLIMVKYISLPNVITSKLLVPELIQNDANAANIATHGMQILANDNADLIKEFSQIHQNLSCNASEKSAKLILEFINE